MVVAFWEGKRGSLEEVIDLKYGSDVGGWCTNAVIEPYGVSLWKFIRRGRDNFFQRVRFEVGKGSGIRFWHDCWCSENTLQETFPDLYRIAWDKDALVDQYLQVCNSSVTRRTDFIRPIQDWELETISSFLDLLYSTKLKGDGEDVLCWKPSIQMGFNVSSYYKDLSRRNDTSFPWKSIWKPKVPSQITFFLWVASLGKILTVENLRRRNIVVVNWCYLCKANGESVDHLLLYCSFSRELWDLVFAFFGVHWVMPETALNLLACWQGSFGKHQHFVIWRCIPHCVMWCIWRERNL